MKDKITYSGLQNLRGIASLLVLFFHAYSTFNRLNFDGAGEYLFDSGFIGVDIFFIISGFVISNSVFEKDITSFKQFADYLKKRWFRIAPAYIFWTLFFIVFYLKDGNYFTSNLNMLIKSLCFLPGDWEYPPLPTGWTLNFEMYFYVLIGVFVFIRQKKLLLIFLAICPVIGFFVETDIIYLDKIVLSKYILEFLAGILIYRFRNSIELSKTLTDLFFYITTCIIVVLYFLHGLHIHIINVMLFSILVYLLIKMEAYRTFKNPVLNFIGDSSYSIYLSHMPVLSYFPLIFKYKFGFSDAFINSSACDFILILIVLICSFISYVCIEKPFIALSKYSFRKSV
ncbi:MAG: acyltransferase family protein [Cytophaga sp.]|uniref:acyltransferase family protein n=1 Tax=Cytophaga sp. TaxID=29535 RepID=UPI003F7F363E